MDALRQKVKAKECEYNILINQLALVGMERKAESKKQSRTIAKMKKELKTVSSTIKQVTSDNTRLTQYLQNTQTLLTEADVQESEMKT